MYVHVNVILLDLLYALSLIFSPDRTTLPCASHSNSSFYHSDNTKTPRRRLFPLSAFTTLSRTLPLSHSLSSLTLLRWRCCSTLASASASPSTVTFRFCVQLFISCLYFFFGRTRNSVLAFCFFTFYSISFIFCEISNNNKNS